MRLSRVSNVSESLLRLQMSSYTFQYGKKDWPWKVCGRNLSGASFPGNWILSLNIHGAIGLIQNAVGTYRSHHITPDLF